MKNHFKLDNGILETAGKKPQNPEQQIYYTLDLTRQYHNLLISEDKAEQKEQTFYWDGNVAAMTAKAGTAANAAAEEGVDCYYLQDDLGSPMQLVDEEGEIRETYGFDEFGLDLGNLPKRQMQPFGYTGYQMEAAGGLYFAQARRYDAENGRFISEDKIPGFTSTPFTLNRYNYCWNQPMEYVDLNGRFPFLVVAVVAVVVEIAVVTGYIHRIDMMDEHYDRNQNQEEYFEQFDSDADIIRAVQTGVNEDGTRNGWVPAPDYQNAYHRFTNGTQGEDAIYNRKYLYELPDGTSYEIVICEGPEEDDDYIVRDPMNMGTYNYQNPNTDGLGGLVGHFWYDMVPYYALSNTYNDNLNIFNRVFGSYKVGNDMQADYTCTQ